MTDISNGPSLWPSITLDVVNSYFLVACLTVVVYDWALTLGQEIELVWRRYWSFMTVLYLSVRYIGIPFTSTCKSPVRLVDNCSTDFYLVMNWTSLVVNVMLGVIIIAWLHAMYQQSRKMLAFLVVTFLVIQIACGVIVVLAMHRRDFSAEELILSGTYQCIYDYEEDIASLFEVTWILGTSWAILVLCLAVWIAMKRFHLLQRSSTGWVVWDCFTALLKAHVFYFVCCLFQLSYFCPTILNSYSTGSEIFDGVLQIVQAAQMFLLGPRLILGIREYRANLVASSGEGTGVTSMVFQERVYITTGGGV